ncbi:unnamed protein product, partial [Mesorhabditis belari]|uniref:Uncharacterized protein n=1 Tax=Mesorhabditis belari TaxID=2138241 RepID=A0AAF3ELI7_9BILA
MSTLDVPGKSLGRKLSGILSRRNSYAPPPLTVCELPAHAAMNPTRPTDTLSLRCRCGYVKHDVMCLGDVVDKEAKLFHFCGGLFIVKKKGRVECAKCRKTSTKLTFTCAFCGLVQDIDLLAVDQSCNWASMDSVQSSVIAYNDPRKQLSSRLSSVNMWRHKIDSVAERDDITEKSSTSDEDEINIIFRNK